MKILMISGSLAERSHTLALLKAVGEHLKEKGCEAILFDLRKQPLPLYDPNFHFDSENDTDPQVVQFMQYAKEANAFIWGTPNYHNSFTGVLKNAIDHLSFDQVRDKPIGLVCNSGGMRNVQPLDHLRIVARGLLGVAIPIQVATCDQDYTMENGEYVLSDPSTLARVQDFCEQLLFFADKLAR